MRTDRQHPMDELTPEQVDRVCPSCRARYKFPLPEPREMYGPLRIDAAAYRWLQNAARVWDAESTEDFPAAEFIAWIKFDLEGRQRFLIPEADGAPPRNNAGSLASPYQTEAHRHPDPIPVVSVRVWRRQAG